MASEIKELIHCYNKGCGNKFDPTDNKEDSCCFHPGVPVFHNAYKSWSCCNKKSIDFTEFLNFKGCTRSFHSNVKPPEPEKPAVEKSKPDEVYEYKAPTPTPKASTRVRPPFDSPLVKLKPEVSDVLRSQIESLIIQQANPAESSGEIQIGTSCKNFGCKASYEGPDSPQTECVYHSQVPVFHEGFKYWPCCKKRTTDFAVFLEQEGCSRGEHVWVKEESNDKQANCRYDWHQTVPNVFLSVYAKKYDPTKSFVEMNPVRVRIHLEFPADNSQFDKDLELFGVVDVDKSEVSMRQTKVEVKLKKADQGSWTRLDAPPPPRNPEANEANAKNEESEANAKAKNTRTAEDDDDDDDDDVVDMEDL